MAVLSQRRGEGSLGGASCPVLERSVRTFQGRIRRLPPMHRPHCGGNECKPTPRATRGGRRPQERCPLCLTVCKRNTC